MSSSVFDLKIGAETTPTQLAKVFTVNFLHQHLGVLPLSGKPYRATVYQVDLNGGGHKLIRPDDSIVYAGLGQWIA